jgi:hypothetical protein
MSKKSRANKVAAVAPAPVVTAPVTPTSKASIRQLVLGEIVKGTSTKDIAALIVLKFPTSMAAAKSQRHISWYRVRAKKVGTPEHKAVEALKAQLIPADAVA